MKSRKLRSTAPAPRVPRPPWRPRKLRVFSGDVRVISLSGDLFEPEWRCPFCRRVKPDKLGLSRHLDACVRRPR
jgi:hypothetical protein